MFTWYAALPDGTITDELVTARGKKVTWSLDAACQAECVLQGDPTGRLTDQTSLVRALETDLLINWNGSSTFGFRGRFGPSEWTIDETSHAEKWSAIDYRGALARRYAREVLTYTATDNAAIVWDLVDHAQSGPSGSFGIGPGTLPTVVDSNLEVPIGKAIADQIEDLSKVYPGFDWWVDADMLINVDRFRGTLRDFALEFPSTVSLITRSFDPSTYGNTVIQTGAEGLTPSVLYADDLEVRPEGRWELVESNPDLDTQPSLDRSAQTSLVRGAASGVSHAFRLKPGTWTPDLLWIGDLVPYRYRSCSRDVDSVERVVQIAVSEDGNGTTQVDIAVGSSLAADIAALNRRHTARLTQLARR